MKKFKLEKFFEGNLLSSTEPMTGVEVLEAQEKFEEEHKYLNHFYCKIARA